MKVLGFLMAVFGFVFFTSLAYANTIEMLNKDDQGNKMVYSQEVANIEVGETITWVPTSKGHNVQFIAGPDGWDLPKKSKNNKEVAITFDTPGIYVYVCTPHATMGMLGVVVVGDGDNDVSKAKVRGKSKKKLKKLLADI